CAKNITWRSWPAVLRAASARRLLVTLHAVSRMLAAAGRANALVWLRGQHCERFVRATFACDRQPCDRIPTNLDRFLNKPRTLPHGSYIGGCVGHHGIGVDGYAHRIVPGLTHREFCRETF